MIVCLPFKIIFGILWSLFRDLISYLWRLDFIVHNNFLILDTQMFCKNFEFVSDQFTNISRHNILTYSLIT